MTDEELKGALPDIPSALEIITTLRAQLTEARTKERQWVEKMVDAEARADRAEAALAAQIEVDAGIAYAQDLSVMVCTEADIRARIIAVAIRTQPHDRTALDRMLTEAKAEALQGPWSDVPDDLTQETIDAAMPFKVRDDYKIYCRALELVSNRHSKGALVGLVNYLLRQSDEAREKAMREALGVIADFDTPMTEDCQLGHEDAYRAILALIEKGATNARHPVKCLPES